MSPLSLTRTPSPCKHLASRLLILVESLYIKQLVSLVPRLLTERKSDLTFLWNVFIV